ncbi:MAG TPA: heavy-metal-associated domain-containing protein [Hanamia sp.]|jgi:copper chaperone CopZ|nr:heavy-metal-associated domain-containing protein [Hanamia sp.]
MNATELKTNIMCGSCIAKVTPVLNEKIGEGKWEVDIQNPNKILSVNNESLTEDDIINAVEKAGYIAEVLP